MQCFVRRFRPKNSLRNSLMWHLHVSIYPHSPPHSSPFRCFLHSTNGSRKSHYGLFIERFYSKSPPHGSRFHIIFILKIVSATLPMYRSQRTCYSQIPTPYLVDTAYFCFSSLYFPSQNFPNFPPLNWIFSFQTIFPLKLIPRLPPQWLSLMCFIP